MKRQRSLLAGYLVSLCCAALAHHGTTTAKEKMEEFGVVPDVLPVAPKATMEVDYGNGVVLHLGNTLTPTQVKTKPINLTWPVEENGLYTLAMVDPDAPSRENHSLREVKHWLVVNIPKLQLESGEEIAGYRGSGPPKGTGLHRYVFVVYKQPALIDVPDERVPSSSRKDRYGWSLNKFATKYNLGEPVAGNFYQAQWDEYVDTIPK